MRTNAELGIGAGKPIHRDYQTVDVGVWGDLAERLRGMHARYQFIRMDCFNNVPCVMEFHSSDPPQVFSVLHGDMDEVGVVVWRIIQGGGQAEQFERSSVTDIRRRVRP